MNMKKRVPNLVVYSALYVAIFGISIWLLVFHPESPTNWVLYIVIIGSILAGVIKFAVHSWKRQRTA